MDRRVLWSVLHRPGGEGYLDASETGTALGRALALGLSVTVLVLPQPGFTLQAGPERALFEHAVTLTPRRPLIAHLRFCLVYPDQCVTHSDRRDPGQNPETRLAEIKAVNRRVNRTIQPRPDEGFDSWDIDVTEGDCEDYALQKRKELLDLGWPSDLMRLAITQTPEGLYHAVLLVRIAGIDYALDNLTERVLPWDQTPYTYLMAQGLEDQRAWYTVSAPPARR